MTDRIEPGLYASEDGSEVVSVCACVCYSYWIRPALPHSDKCYYVDAATIRRRWPLRVVRCEVEG